MITAHGLHERYGDKVAVDDLSFDVRPGVVTGFLGPNGAGKSTTMRLMLDLDHGAGETRFDGKRFRDIRDPMREIGAVLEAKAIHPRRCSAIRGCSFLMSPPTAWIRMAFIGCVMC
jgi:ABC-2 type transport system ATP-binding protein